MAETKPACNHCGNTKGMVLLRIENDKYNNNVLSEYWICHNWLTVGYECEGWANVPVTEVVA